MTSPCVKNGEHGVVLKRLLFELNRAISNRNAINGLWKATPTISGNSFFYYANLALYDDMISHVIKVLDANKDSRTFWAIFFGNKAFFKNNLKTNGSTFSAINKLRKKLKKIRDKTHFHIDKKAVLSPEKIWEEANISKDEFNKVVDVLWKLLNELYLESFKERFPYVIYEAEDIELLIEAVKKGSAKSYIWF